MRCNEAITESYRPMMKWDRMTLTIPLAQIDCRGAQRKKNPWRHLDEGEECRLEDWKKERAPQSFASPRFPPKVSTMGKAPGTLDAGTRARTQ